MSTTAPSAKDIVGLAVDALNERDRDAFAALHADHVALHSSDEEDVRGVDAVVEEEFALFDAFSDLTYVLHEIIAEDDLVAARWTAAGTHDGDLGEIRSTGASVEFEVMGQFRVEDGRVTEAWVLPDRLTLMRQLGATGSPTV